MTCLLLASIGYRHRFSVVLVTAQSTDDARSIKLKRFQPRRHAIWLVSLSSAMNSRTHAVLDLGFYLLPFCAIHLCQ